MLIASLLFIWVQTPYYTNPVHPDKDKILLQMELSAKQTFDQEKWAKKIALYTETGQLFSASDLILQLSAEFPDNVIFKEAEILVAAHEKKWKHAYMLGDEFLEKFTQHPTIRVNLARIYSSNGDQARAMNLLLDQIEYHELKNSEWAVLFSVLSKSGIEGRSWIQTLEEKMQQHPDLLSLKKVYLTVLIRYGAYDKAYALMSENAHLFDYPEMKSFFKSLEAFQ
jgi:hypothetical protein